MAQNPAISALRSEALLKSLQEDPRYQAVMSDVLDAYRPPVPNFEPRATTEENLALLEQIKFSYGMQKGFDLLFSLLTGHTPT